MKTLGILNNQIRTSAEWWAQSSCSGYPRVVLRNNHFHIHLIIIIFKSILFRFDIKMTKIDEKTITIFVVHSRVENGTNRDVDVVGAHVLKKINNFRSRWCQIQFGGTKSSRRWRPTLDRRDIHFSQIQTNEVSWMYSCKFVNEWTKLLAR
jgi:hypothetical protein